MPVPPGLAVLGILLFLLLGFVCGLIIRQITFRARQSDFEKVIEALVFSFILYLACIPLFGNTLPVSWCMQQSGVYEVHLRWAELVTILFTSLVASCLYAAMLQHDLLHRLLRKIGLTEKTSRTSIWNDVLQDIKRTYLLVELRDGRRVVGYLTYYSDDPEESSLFLEDAAWLAESGEQVAIEGPGILLTKEAGISTISFLDPA